MRGRPDYPSVPRIRNWLVMRSRIGSLHRSVTTVAATVVAWAQRSAPRLSYRAKARDAAGHSNTHIRLALTLDAHTIGRNIRLASGQRCGDQFYELVFVDRTTTQFEIDGNVLRDRSRELQRADELRCGVHDPDELIDILPVTQSLNAAGRGTGPNRDQSLALPAHFLNTLGILIGGDRPLDQADVIRTLRHRARGFREIGNIHCPSNAEQFIFRVEQA